ncbi:MAG: rod shape-determining protein [Candidatus Woykebacteria bacterium GWB1_45_5]|uniref:Cell shape-determining protein MreB n=1 Tax=Candidatus Woykebacteria bacterium GWB1_45_5 TaxID=1802592 RepID=A0A1G1WAN7_9BACT|nr:MAG: rod shape-determining protein [Candidatus Woykebacteria bacterium GWB1_45_5]
MNFKFNLNPLDYFWGAFSLDLGVDLGTANTKIAVCGKGVMVREPTVVAAHKKTKQLLAIGSEAKKMLGKTPASIIATRPLRDGVINDLDFAESLLKHFIHKVHQTPTSFPKIPRPKIAIAVPSGATEVERRAVSDAATAAGAREVYLVDEPMAAALGAGLPIDEPKGHMIVDIGAGTTEIAIISLGGIVVSKSLRVAGDEMDGDIISYTRARYNLLLGEKSAEESKIGYGSAYPARKESKLQISGRDLATGLPVAVTTSTGEIREAISNTLRTIIEGIKDVIEESPPELVNDVAQEGIYLTGGGALLKGWPALLAKETRMPTILAQDPLTRVVKGTAKVLEDDRLYRKIKFAGSLR